LIDQIKTDEFFAEEHEAAAPSNPLQQDGGPYAYQHCVIHEAASINASESDGEKSIQFRQNEPKTEEQNNSPHKTHQQSQDQDVIDKIKKRQ